MNFDPVTTIARPPEKVFRLTADSYRFGEWMPGFVRFERLTPGPLQKGSRSRATRNLFGLEVTEEFEVTEPDATRTFGLFVVGSKGAGKKGEFRFRYTFSPSVGGTEVKLAGEVANMGCVGSVLGFPFAGKFRKMIGKDLAAMKSCIEKLP